MLFVLAEIMDYMTVHVFAWTVMLRHRAHRCPLRRHKLAVLNEHTYSYEYIEVTTHYNNNRRDAHPAGLPVDVWRASQHELDVLGQSLVAVDPRQRHTLQQTDKQQRDARHAVVDQVKQVDTALWDYDDTDVSAGDNNLFTNQVQ